MLILVVKFKNMNRIKKSGCVLNRVFSLYLILKLINILVISLIIICQVSCV